MKWINRLYILFLGIILAITTGFGVAAFYPQPVSPVYPSTNYKQLVPQSCYATPQAQSSIECQAAIQKEKDHQAQEDMKRDEYQKTLEDYQNKNAGYTRTAIFFGIVFGVIFAVVGISVIKVSKLVANGLLLGSVLTTILTRMLISVASLGASVSRTTGADSTAYLEFGILLVLSVVVVIAGLLNLKDHETSP